MKATKKQGAAVLISKKMNQAINEQTGHEFSAMMQYIAIASYFSTEGLTQLAGYFFHQAEEERHHAMRFIRYVLDAGGEVGIPDTPSPKTNFRNAAEAVRHSLEQEKEVTRQINRLVELAIKESDHITQRSLDWFVNEQLEEVSTMDQLLKVIQRAGEQNLLYVEEYLARQKAQPSPAGPEVA